MRPTFGSKGRPGRLHPRAAALAAAGRGSAVGFTVCARPHPLLHSVLGAHCVPEASATMAADSRDAAPLGIFDALPLLAAALVAAAARSTRSEARKHLLREEASESYGRLGARQALQDKFLSVIQERLAALLAELDALWKHAQAGEVVAAATGIADAAADAAMPAPKRRSISGTNKILGRIEPCPSQPAPSATPSRPRPRRSCQLEAVGGCVQPGERRTAAPSLREARAAAGRGRREQ